MKSSDDDLSLSLFDQTSAVVANGPTLAHDVQPAACDVLPADTTDTSDEPELEKALESVSEEIHFAQDSNMAGDPVSGDTGAHNGHDLAREGAFPPQDQLFLLEPPSESVLDTEPPFTQLEVVEQAFQYFRQTGFPFKAIPIHVGMQELNALATAPPESLKKSRLGYAIADTYHPHRVEAHATGKISPWQSFHDDERLKRALRLMIAEEASVGTALPSLVNMVLGTQACANFRPGFACYLYRRFAPSKNCLVLDTSTGYGGRLVGFLAAGLAHYYGIDPHPLTHAGNTKLAHDYGASERVTLFNAPAEDVDPNWFPPCDLAFTSPPYFAKEQYSDDDTQSWIRYKTGDEWRVGFLQPMLRLQFAVLKPGGINIVNIADVTVKNKVYPLKLWTLDDAKEIGFTIESVEEFALTNRYGAHQDEEQAVEPVIIMRKPTKEAHDALLGKDSPDSPARPIAA